MADRELSWDQLVTESRDRADARDRSQQMHYRNEPGQPEIVQVVEPVEDEPEVGG
jgi:hypothetical protein